MLLNGLRGERHECASAFFLLLLLQADSKTRFSRVCARRSSTDSISWQKFLADDEREMQSEAGLQNEFEQAGRKVACDQRDVVSAVVVY